MLIRCAHCQKTMKLDEQDLPDAPKIKVRCPHCQGIGYVEKTSPAISGSEPSLTVKKGINSSDQSQNGFTEAAHPEAEMKYDISLPDDAFKDFRFPAEEDEREKSQKKIIGSKQILFVIASILVVIVFALLVNIILPGPSGVRGLTGAVEPEQGLTAPDVDVSAAQANPPPIRLKNRSNR